MTKKELSVLLNSIEIPVGEGEQFLESKGKYPKIAYWEYVWTDKMSSGSDYSNIVTYQISFASAKPRDAKLLQLKKALNDKNLHPTIYHEYVASENSPGYYHSYFSIDVEEDI